MNIFEKVNNEIFAELDRLNAADTPEEAENEIARAKAVKDLVNAAISNVNSMCKVVQTAEMTGQQVKVPKNLLEDS